MKEVFVHHDPAVVGLHKSILEAAGIASYIRNENTSTSLGGAFFGTPETTSSEPALCVVDDDNYDQAMEILKGALTPAVTQRADWKCAECGETVPGNFEVCWNCSAELPSAC